MRCAARGPATDGAPPRVPGASAAAPRETAEGSAASADFTYKLIYQHAELVLLRAVWGSGGDPAQRRAVLDACDAAVRRMHRAGFPAAPLCDELGVCCVVPHSPQGRIEADVGRLLRGLLAEPGLELSRESPPPLHKLSDAIALYVRAALAQKDWAEVRGEMRHSASRLMLGRGSQFEAARLSFACSTDPAGAAVVTARVVPRQVSVIPVPLFTARQLPEETQERYDRGGFVLFAGEGAAPADGIRRPAAAERDSSVLVLPALARAEGAGIGRSPPVFDRKREDGVCGCKCVLEQGQLPRVRAHLLMSHLQRTLHDACCVPPKGHCGPVFAPWLLPPELGGSDSDLRFGFPASLPRGGLGMRVIDHNRPEQRKSQGETVPPQ